MDGRMRGCRCARARSLRRDGDQIVATGRVCGHAGSLDAHHGRPGRLSEPGGNALRIPARCGSDRRGWRRAALCARPRRDEGGIGSRGDGRYCLLHRVDDEGLRRPARRATRCRTRVAARHDTGRRLARLATAQPRPAGTCRQPARPAGSFHTGNGTRAISATCRALARTLGPTPDGRAGRGRQAPPSLPRYRLTPAAPDLFGAQTFAYDEIAAMAFVRGTDGNVVGLDWNGERYGKR